MFSIGVPVSVLLLRRKRAQKRTPATLQHQRRRVHQLQQQQQQPQSQRQRHEQQPLPSNRSGSVVSFLSLSLWNCFLVYFSTECHPEVFISHEPGQERNMSDLSALNQVLHGERVILALWSSGREPPLEHARVVSGTRGSCGDKRFYGGCELFFQQRRGQGQVCRVLPPPLPLTRRRVLLPDAPR